MVPIPTLPLRAVVVILSLPSTTVLEPRPIKSVPITISFNDPFALALVLFPRKIEPLALVSAEVPLPKYLPALSPIATLLLPVTFSYKAAVPIDIFLLPDVLNLAALLPTAMFLLPEVLESKAAGPNAVLLTPSRFAFNAYDPIPVLLNPVVLNCSEFEPTAVLF